jgi:hypothetical protein
MADWKFTGSNLFHTVISLTFAPVGGKHPLAISMQIEEASLLMAGLLGRLRQAAHMGQTLDPLTLEDGREVPVAELRVDKAATVESLDAPERIGLLLSAADGLNLVYSLDRRLARELGSALIRSAGDAN